MLKIDDPSPIAWRLSYPLYLFLLLFSLASYRSVSPSVSLRACAPFLFIHRIPSQFLGIPLWTIDRDQRGTHGSGIYTSDLELRASPCPSRTADPINGKSSDGFLEEPIEAAQTTILILGERLIVTSLLFFTRYSEYGDGSIQRIRPKTLTSKGTILTRIT